MKQLNINTLEITISQDSGLGEEFRVVYGNNSKLLAWTHSSDIAEKLIDGLERKQFKDPFVKKALMLAYLQEEFDRKGLSFSVWIYATDLIKQALLKFYGREFTFHILASTKDNGLYLKKTVIAHNILNGDMDASLYVTKMLEIFKDVQDSIELANESFGKAQEIIKTL